LQYHHGFHTIKQCKYISGSAYSVVMWNCSFGSIY